MEEVVAYLLSIYDYPILYTPILCFIVFVVEGLGK